MTTCPAGPAGAEVSVATTTGAAAGLELREHAFPDHHAFRAADLDFGDALPVLMTSKDAVKCRAFADARLWELPVEARLEPGGGEALLERVATLVAARP